MSTGQEILKHSTGIFPALYNASDTYTLALTDKEYKLVYVVDSGVVDVAGATVAVLVLSI
jgi:hypothetical protein